jgi:hypothetical protein
MAEKSEEKQFPIFSLVVPYGISVSLLYLFGYWSKFGINVLQYTSLSDVVKLAFYPVCIGALLSLSGLFLQMIVRGQFKETDPAKVFIFVGPQFVKWSSIAAAILLFAFISIWPSKGFSWVMAGVFLAYIVNINIDDFTALKPFIANPVVRRFVFYSLLVVFFSFFGRGVQDAENILNSKYVKEVSTAIFKGQGTNEFKSKGLLDKHSTLKYIGACGDYFIFLTPDNEETIIAKYNDLHFVSFRRK